MSIVSKIITNSIDGIVDNIAKGLDELFTSDEERLSLKNKLEQIRLESKLKSVDLANKHEKEITKRWISDNENVITRIVRPLIVIWSFILLTSVMLFDGNLGEFTVKEAYLPMLETIVTTCVIAYMGSRGIEKVTKAFNKEK